MQQRDVVCLSNAATGQVRGQRAWSRWRSLLRRLDQLLCVHDRFERTHARLQQSSHSFGAAKRQQQTSLGVVQNARLPLGIFLDAVGAERRINRHGNCAGKQNSRVGNEKLARRWEHHRHAPACTHSAARQLRSALLRGGIELAESKRKLVSVVFGDAEVLPRGIVRGAVAQHVD